MPSKERKLRQQAQLRTAVLLAAESIAANEGWDAVTMRRLADEIDYTPPTLYELFENKDGLLQALARKGFLDLGERFATINESLSPEQYLLYMGKLYWQFSQEHPGLYDAMFGLGLPNCDFVPEGEAVFQSLVEAVSNVCKEDTAQDVHTTAILIWSSLHGFISLSRNNSAFVAAHKRVSIETLLNRIIDGVIKK